MKTQENEVVRIMTSRAWDRVGDSGYLAFRKLEFVVAEDLQVELCICPQSVV